LRVVKQHVAIPEEVDVQQAIVHISLGSNVHDISIVTDVVYQYFPRLTFPGCITRPLDLNGNVMDTGEGLQPGQVKGELPITLPERVCRPLDNGGI